MPGGKNSSRKRAKRIAIVKRKRAQASLPAADPSPPQSLLPVLDRPGKSKDKQPYAKRESDGREIYEKPGFLIPVLLALATILGVTASMIYSANFLQFAEGKSELEEDLQSDSAIVTETAEVDFDGFIPPAKPESKPLESGSSITDNMVVPGDDQVSFPAARTEPQEASSSPINLGNDHEVTDSDLMVLQNESDAADGKGEEAEGVSLENQKKIYLSLLPSRKKAMEAAARRSRGVAGAQAEYRSLSRAFFKERLTVQALYGITANELEEIILLGDKNDWASEGLE